MLLFSRFAIGRAFLQRSWTSVSRQSNNWPTPLKTSSLSCTGGKSSPAGKGKVMSGCIHVNNAENVHGLQCHNSIHCTHILRIERQKVLFYWASVFWRPNKYLKIPPHEYLYIRRMSHTRRKILGKLAGLLKCHRLHNELQKKPWHWQYVIINRAYPVAFCLQSSENN
jgi:hypothetical protein